MNGGTCIDGVDNFTCSCPPNLTGVFCECLIVGQNEFDCTYVSPTSVTFTISTKSASVSTTTKLNVSTEIEKITKLTSETTEVPNLVTISYYSTETSTTEETTLLSTSTEVSYETSPESEPISSTIAVLNGTVSEEIDTTTLTTLTLPEVSSTTFSGVTLAGINETTTETETETTKELVYSNESSKNASTAIYETSTKYSLTSTEIKLPKTTFSIEVTETPNTTFSVSTVSSPQEAASSFIYPEDTTLISSVTPFMTVEPRSEAFTTLLPISSTIVGEYNLTTVSGLIPDCTQMGNECRNGGTCVFSTDGYRVHASYLGFKKYNVCFFQCVCPFDVEGPTCDVSVGIKNAAFNGDSYLSHRLLNYTNITVEFKAKTLSPNGLLFYSNVDNIYMMLYLERGYLTFKFSCGFQTMLLTEMEIPLNNGYEMDIKTE